MSPRTATRLRWLSLAVAGLLVAVAVGVAAAAMTSRQIGLSSESVRAGESLAPKSPKSEDGGRKSGRNRPKDGRSHRGGDSTTTTVPSTSTTTITPPATTTTPPATTTTAPPTTSTDDSSSSDNSGEGDGGDD